MRDAVLIDPALGGAAMQGVPLASAKVPVTIGRRLDRVQAQRQTEPRTRPVPNRIRAGELLVDLLPPLAGHGLDVDIEQRLLNARRYFAGFREVKVL